MVRKNDYQFQTGFKQTITGFWKKKMVLTTLIGSTVFSPPLSSYSCSSEGMRALRWL